MEGTSGKIDYGLLRRFSALLLCSRCLRQGVKSPVAQVISPRHTLQSLCPDCRAARRLEAS